MSEAKPAAPPFPSPASLAGLSALGTLSALWAQVLWASLLVSRSSGLASCPLGDGAACGALWDGPFASAVQRLSGVPVAGWGVAWGLVALALPLEALRRRAEGREDPALLSAIRLVGAAGLLATLGLVAVALAERAFCAGCFVSYLLAAGYAGIAVFGWKPLGLPLLPRGAVAASSLVLLAWLLLLYPGSRTPAAAAAAGEAAVARAAAGSAGGDRSGPIAELVDQLDPQMQQALADSLAIYRSAPAVTLPEPRALEGAAGAPVRITEFTDVLCPHCADLYRTIDQVRRFAPADSFAVEARHFPLDASCNPLVERSGEPVRCLAARVRICAEGDPRAPELARALFDAQAALSEARVREIAAGFLPAAELEACIASEETERRLREDVELAGRFDVDGTPLVVVNGRRGTAFGPFLYAVVLTGGAADHPAFGALPPGRADAHIH